MFQARSEPSHLLDAFFLESLRSADYRVINLEPANGMVAGRREKSTFLEESWVVDALVEAKIDAVNLANNHIHDLGTEGIRQTIHFLNSHGISVFGVGESIQQASKPLFVSENLALFGFCDFDKPYLRQIQVASDQPGVNPLREEHVLRCLDSLPAGAKSVLYFHWGREHVNFPPIDDIELARRILRDPRVLTIIGGHAHKLQGILRVSGKQAFMSLGNFLFPNFTIEPPCHYYPHDHDFSALPVIYDYHTVFTVTRKRWRRTNRKSIHLVFNTKTGALSRHYTVQRPGKAVLSKPANLSLKIIDWKIRLLSRMDNYCPRALYLSLSNAEHGKNVIIRRLKGYQRLMNQYGVRWFIGKIWSKIVYRQGSNIK